MPLQQASIAIMATLVSKTKCHTHTHTHTEGHSDVRKGRMQQQHRIPPLG
jgi:hypothetical protein